MNLPYKYRQFMEHLLGPAGSIVVHILAVVVLINFAMTPAAEKPAEVEVIIMEPDAQKLDEIRRQLHYEGELSSSSTFNYPALREVLAEGKLFVSECRLAPESK